MDMGEKVEVEVDTKETYKVFLAQVQGVSSVRRPTRVRLTWMLGVELPSCWAATVGTLLP